MKDLKVYYKLKRATVRAVDGVTFSLEQGRILGVVGESGCGKSTLAVSILRVLPRNAYIAGGKIILCGIDVTRASEKELERKVRGKLAAMIFQDPMTSLNPTMKIADHIVEALTTHYDLSEEEARRRALEALAEVGISPERADDYPHQLSGGMRQRVMIALALALKPKLIIADEPTTALDVVVQAQILDLFNKVRNEINSSIMIITHNMGVVAYLCDEVMVMYAGKIVEKGTVEQVFYNPMHPYTQGLIKSIPKPGMKASDLHTIPGSPPDMRYPPPGCRFHPRCPYAKEQCMKVEPELVEVEPGHLVACHLYSAR